MKKNTKLIYIFGFIFVIIIFVTIFVITKIGSVYKKGIEDVGNENTQEEMVLIKKSKIKKVTVKNKEDKGCIEVTADGIVRVYDDCGKDLKDASRLNDPKNILKLIKIISEKNFDKYREKKADSFEVIIETEDGTETIYLPENEDPDGIIETIEDIIDDIPASSSLASGILPSIYPSTSSFSSSLPSGYLYSSPSPTSLSSPVLQPFTCDFTESTDGKKPTNVSNIICSTDPLTPP